jgi:CBS domain-containing protein
MTISDVMTTDVKCVRATTTAADARALMRRHNFHHLVVTNGDNLVGIVSARDLGRRRASPAAKQTVEDAMNRHVLTIDRTATLGRAAFTMRGRGVGCLVVLERGKVAGLVTAADLLGLIDRSVQRGKRADVGSAIHHRVPHRHQARSSGKW